MRRTAILVLLAVTVPQSAAAQCRLCTNDGAPTEAALPARPLGVEIETGLDFSRAAQARGGGSIAIDAQSGAHAVSGLVDLGGMAFKGVVRVSGEPGRHVRVTLPSAIALSASDGGSAQVVDLQTDLPPDPALDGRGALTFSFGGRLIVGAGASGDFRGRVPVTVDYR